MVGKPSALIICCAALAASSGVQAVGFGRVAPSVVLGQPLNIVIPLVLDQGERLFSECIQAEVTAGDTQLLGHQVRVSAEPTANPAEWRARVMTTVPILEPIVEVAVSAGCERRFMRRFTAFADPPSHAAPSLSMSTSPSELAVAQPVPAGDMGPGVAIAPVRSGSRASRAPKSVVVKPSAAAPAHAARPSRVERAASKAVPREEQVAKLLLDVGGPSLKMDIEEPVFMPPAAGASGASDGMVDDIDRLQLLEKTLGELKKETQTYRNNEAGLKARLDEAESRSRLVPWLLGLAVVSLLAAVAAVLWARRRQSEDTSGSVASASEPLWWQSNGETSPPPVAAAKAADSVPADAVDSVAGSAVVLPDEPAAAQAVVSPYERTQPFGPGDVGAVNTLALASLTEGQLPREVSVEELLDLEQQADFFIALGQEDAAVDLLMSHLRGTGGQSPLPYTKLLEIYRRQEDRTSYERIRARFNRRFNAYAPDWDQGPLHGRSLEDYPEVVRKLQALWASPLNSMAVLEAMLFRNDEAQDLFDLPAYKDVLLLYSLARDLYQQDGVSAADVDLLLPLGDDDLFLPSGGGDHAKATAAAGDASYELTTFHVEAGPLDDDHADHRTPDVDDEGTGLNTR